jgi:RNA polymerase sigma-32 factor
MARYINEEPGLLRYVEEVERLPALERDEELELARRYRDHADQRAGDRLIRAHLRSVVKVAQRFRGYGIYISDLVAEGNLGLLEAARRFDPERGLRFLTYARYWVRAYMLAHVLKHWSIVDMGTTALQSKMFFRLQSERARLLNEVGEEDGTIDQRLAESLGTSEDAVRTSLERLRRRDASLDAPLVADGTTTFLDTLGGDAEQEERVAAAELSSQVQGVIAALRPTLDRRESLILDERLLAEDGDEITLASLGTRLGVTRERVRQLEVGVKAKLRNALVRAMGCEGLSIFMGTDLDCSRAPAAAA